MYSMCVRILDVGLFLTIVFWSSVRFTEKVRRYSQFPCIPFPLPRFPCHTILYQCGTLVKTGEPMLIYYYLLKVHGVC